MSESDDDSIQVTQHWGEISDESFEDSATVSCVLEDIKRSMQHNCLDAYPDDENALKVSDISIPAFDPLVLHAIELHKWMSKTKEAIRVAKESKSRAKPSTEDAKIPIPEMPNAAFLSFISHGSSKKFNADVDFPELSDAIVKQLLPKCVAIMAAQIGLEDSFQSVLDVLVDAYEQCLIKLCDKVSSAYREQEDLNTKGFPNPIERVLVELGFGGAKGLHNFYQSRVIKYVFTLQKRCKRLEKEYLDLLAPKSKTATEPVELSFAGQTTGDSMDGDLGSGSSLEEITLHSSQYFRDSETIDMILQ